MTPDHARLIEEAEKLLNRYAPSSLEWRSITERLLSALRDVRELPQPSTESIQRWWIEVFD